MLSRTDCIAAISTHSDALAAAAREHLEVVVRHCPGWTVADLVAHLIDVHWTWTSLVEGGLIEPIPPESRPARVSDDELVATFEAGARRMVRVFEEADPTRPVWTWAPAHQDAAFVIRHQVQEIAVHHWDTIDAVRGTDTPAAAADTADGTAAATIAPAVAADAIDEFLEVSISSDVDPADDGAPVLAGSFALRCTDTGAEVGTDGPGVWRVTDGTAPGTMRATEGSGVADGLPTISGKAADLLLWLYQRVEVDTAAVDPALLQRFRALTYTT